MLAMGSRRWALGGSAPQGQPQTLPGFTRDASGNVVKTPKTSSKPSASSSANQAREIFDGGVKLAQGFRGKMILGKLVGGIPLPQALSQLTSYFAGAGVKPAMAQTLARSALEAVGYTLPATTGTWGSPTGAAGG